jgi:hypothetical protein
VNLQRFTGLVWETTENPIFQRHWQLTLSAFAAVSIFAPYKWS